MQSLLNATNHMNIRLKPRESVFNGLVLRERINEYKLHQLINSDVLKIVTNKIVNKSYTNEKEALQNYRTLVKDGYAHILYSKHEYGRCVAKDGLSLLGLRKPIRHTLTNEYMVDLDIQNAHPVLMVQMLDYHGFKCKYLKDYVTNRDKWFELVKKHWNIDSLMNTEDARDCAKVLFLRIIYGGGYKNWVEEFKLPIKEFIPTELQGFLDEFEQIKALFMELNPELTEELRLKKGKECINLGGSVTSSVMLEKECNVLEVIYLYLRRRGISDCISLCADGIMISKSEYNPKLLAEIEVEVLCQTGFIIHMSEKKMDKTINDLDEHVVNQKPFKPNDNFKQIDQIKNRLDVLLTDFQSCDLYHKSMKVVKQKGNQVIMTCNTQTKCNLCKAKHEYGHCYIHINKTGNFEFCCHNKKKVFKKSEKGLTVVRSIQKENIDSNIKDYFELNTDGVIVINESSRFLGCNEENEFVMKKEYNNKFLLLNAQMGKGKSNGINALLSLHTEERVLFVSQRKTFTNFICSEFKNLQIKNYLDIKDNNYTHKALCIQVESLHKIDASKYDIIIIDECETVLNQFSSTTMTKTNDCWNTLKEVVLRSSWCVLADAFITNRTIEFAKSLKRSCEQITLLNNDRPFLEGRQCIQISQDSYTVRIVDALKLGKRVVFISSSRDDLLELNSILKHECPDKQCKIYDKDSDKTDLGNVNEIWSKLDFVGYTPVIQTGVSYMGEPFNICFANLKSSNLARDAMQMLMRCRKLKDNLVYFSVSKRQIYNTSNIEMFETFDSFQDDRKSKTNILIGKLLKEGKRNQELVSMLATSLDTTDCTLLKMMWYNLREYMLSRCHYNAICLLLLNRQGYEVKLLQDDEHNKEKKKEKNDDVDYVDDYENIEDIDDEEVKEMSQNNSKDKTGRLCVDKFYFEKMTISDLPVEMKAKLFFEYYQCSYKKKHLTNVKYERSDIDTADMIEEDYVKSDELINNMKMTSVKLEHIRNINRLLKLDNSCHNGKVVDKTLITVNTLKYIQKHIKELSTLYNSKIRLTGSAKNDNFATFTLLKKMYNDWSGLSFKKHNITKGIVTSYITECDEYYNYIKPFEKRVPCRDDSNMMDSDDEC
jgi:hypothetical protein